MMKKARFMIRPKILIGLCIGLTCTPLAFGQTSAQKLVSDLPPSLHPGDISVGFIQERVLEHKVPAEIMQMPQGSSFFPEYVFLVDKEARSLSIWSMKEDVPTRVGHYPTDIGKKRGDKVFQGDHRTPEGVYFFQTQIPGRKLDFKLYGSRAFTTNYPNLFDQREKKTGSGIWLHAVPDETPLTRGSRGCVVVRDKVINEMPGFISPKRTPIIITEKATYLSTDQWNLHNEDIRNWLESWRSAWVSGNVDRYMGFYSRTRFRSKKMRYTAWKKYKKRIARKNKVTEVELTRAVGYNDGDTAIIQFLQRYRSDSIEDFGQKSLYLRQEHGEWKIVAEKWAPVSRSQWQAEYRLKRTFPTQADDERTTVGSLEKSNVQN